MNKMRIAGVLAGAALLFGGGVAVASIPAPDGTVKGCYKNNGGDLKVIDSAASCPGGYTPLNWSQTGPSGPQGEQGPQGEPGASATSSVVTDDVHFAPPMGDGSERFQTVSCPGGKKAINGGVIKATADSEWNDSSPYKGEASSVNALESFANGNFTIPRPIADGTGWRIYVNYSFPRNLVDEQYVDVGMTVTLFAICL
jgi:hypothetical protein